MEEYLVLTKAYLVTEYCNRIDEEEDASPVYGTQDSAPRN